MDQRPAREDFSPILRPDLGPLPDLRFQASARPVEQLPGAWIVFRDFQRLSPVLNDVSADPPMKGNRFYRFLLHGEDEIATENDRICPVTSRPGNWPIAVTANLQIAAHLAEEALAPGDFR